MANDQPKILLTAGEPAGIGPDLVLRAASEAWPAHLVCVADKHLLASRAAALGLAVRFVPYSTMDPARPHTPGELPYVHIPLETAVTPGMLDTRNASYVLATLAYAVEACRCGEFAAMVTAPVQKSIIADSGIPFSGHTEFLAEETGAESVVMLLAAGALRVALATTHLPLRAVADAINADLLGRVLQTLHADLRDKFGLPTPRITVLGLNPHAGEGGHLGREEIEIIGPVCTALRAQGLQIRGPVPADTAFEAAIRADTDAYLAMYHDQGLPVLKYAGFGSAVNITLGLPIVRTSVDHGTALTLAGTGNANPGSLYAAIDAAIELAQNTTGT